MNENDIEQYTTLCRIAQIRYGIDLDDYMLLPVKTKRVIFDSVECILEQYKNTEYYVYLYEHTFMYMKEWDSDECL